MAPARLLTGLALITAVAFAGAARAPFEFDDIASIPDNPTIRTLWPPSIALNPPPNISVSGRPVVNLSFALNFAVNEALGISQRPAEEWELETVGYHVVNIALHILCGLLLFGVVRRTLRSERIQEEWRNASDGVALAVTALWMLHPIQTEAVSYVIQRTELLVSLFYLGTLYASIRAWDAASRRATFGWYAAAISACALGMGSKEVMISAPLAVMLYDRAFRFDSWRQLRLHRERLAFHGVLQLTLLVLVVESRGARDATVTFQGDIAWHEYLRSQGWAVLHYLRLVAWPDALSYDYGSRPIGVDFGVGGLFVLTLAAIGTLLAWKRAPWLAFSGSVFFLLLAPSSSVVPIQTEIAAERRMYLALAPVFLVIVVSAIAWARRVGIDFVAPRAARAGFIGLLAALALRTGQRSLIYNDPETLWRDATEKVPGNARALNNLAAAVLRKGPARQREAEIHFRRSMAADSTFVAAWANLADIEVRRGRPAVAREVLEHAVRVNPNSVIAGISLGSLLVKLGDPALGIFYLERALAAYPTVDGYSSLASAYLDLARMEGAERALRSLLRLDPNRLDAINMLGTLLMTSGRASQAIPYLEVATRDPNAPVRTLAFLSLAYAQGGHTTQALVAVGRARPRIAGDVATLVLLGRTMLTLDSTASADRFFSEALRLAPDDPESTTRLGMAKAVAGKRSEAIALFRRALRLQPDFRPARDALEKVLSLSP
jgi:tetratricopeptide (TPR) repeat protein